MIRNWLLTLLGVRILPLRPGDVLVVFSARPFNTLNVSHDLSSEAGFRVPVLLAHPHERIEVLRATPDPYLQCR